MALTLLDVLGYLKEIPICTAYEIDGKPVQTFPVPARLNEARPVLESFPGWNCDISSVRDFDNLPEEAQNYVRFIEKQVGVPVRLISVGPRREDIIKLPR